MQMYETFKIVSTSVFFPENVVKEHGNQLKLGQKTKIVFVKYIKIYKSNTKNCEQTFLSVFQGLCWYVFYIISLK